MTKTILIILLYLGLPLIVKSQDVKQFDSSEILLVDTLSVESFYEIIRHSQGCFHSYRDTLKISRKNDGLFISFQGNELILQGKLLEHYKSFERALLYDLHFGGCTTSEDYILKTNAHEVLLTSDSSCKWDGFDNFINQIE